MDRDVLVSRIETIRDIIENDPDLRRDKDLKRKIKKAKKIKSLNELDKYLSIIEEMIDKKEFDSPTL